MGYDLLEESPLIIIADQSIIVITVEDNSCLTFMRNGRRAVSCRDLIYNSFQQRKRHGASFHRRNLFTRFPVKKVKFKYITFCLPVRTLHASWPNCAVTLFNTFAR